MKLYTIIYTIALAFILSSCSFVNKVFNKNKSRTDSTTYSAQRVDEVISMDSNRLIKTITEGEQEITFWFGEDPGILAPFKDSGINDTGIYIQPKNAWEYFFEVVEGKVKTNMPIKKAVVKGKQKTEAVDSGSKKVATEKQSQTETSKTVSAKSKEVTKQVKKWRFNWWWLLLLIPVYLIIRYWKRIKSALSFYPF